MSAVISSCGTYRYRLEREVQDVGITIAYFGVNGSTATATENDHTVAKWLGFTRVHGGKRFIVGNAFAYRSKDVSKLATADDPVGPENDAYLRGIISDADLLVPCWGNRTKIPKSLRPQLDRLMAMLLESGKPVKTFGLTVGGDPKHPQMLAYSTVLVPWSE